MRRSRSSRSIRCTPLRRKRIHSPGTIAAATTAGHAPYRSTTRHFWRYFSCFFDVFAPDFRA